MICTSRRTRHNTFVSLTTLLNGNLNLCYLQGETEDSQGFTVPTSLNSTLGCFQNSCHQALQDHFAVLGRQKNLISTYTFTVFLISFNSPVHLILEVFFLFGVEYRNCCQTLDVYLLFVILLGQIKSKLNYRVVTYKVASP